MGDVESCGGGEFEDDGLGFDEGGLHNIASGKRVSKVADTFILIGMEEVWERLRDWKRAAIGESVSVLIAKSGVS